uniref:Uncharacterized protein n=1 Tax=Leersia perrieri TaxID=77586 RepID=A0A0D9V9Q8_9ORYZ
MAAAARTKGVRTKSLISRTLERCKSGLAAAGGGRATAAPVAGCFTVYVGDERERFVVRAEYANHPLFRRLLDDAEREYGYAAQGPLALPCAVDAFLDVLWQMQHAGDVGDGDDVGEVAAVAASPICGLRRSCGSKGRTAAAGYRMLSSPARSSSPASFLATPARKKR